MNLSVLVYDDDGKYAKKYADRLRKVKGSNYELDVSEISPDRFRTQMQVVALRQAALRENKKPDFSGTDFDQADIFVVDFDLIKTYPGSGFLTGEEVCYSIRCFSHCGLLVGLNQFGWNPFDLTLCGHPRSFADLNIGEKQLDKAGLWSGKSEFRPWYWPDLPQYAQAFKWKIKDVLNNLDASILTMLGLREKIGTFPKETRNFLGPGLKAPKPKEFCLKSGNGLRPKDNRTTDEIVSRVTAARISKWLERLVLPGQDILVDAPHLVFRYPSLLKGNPEDLNTWNESVKFEDHTRLGIDHRAIEAFRFKKGEWLSRPAWLWNGVSNSKSVREATELWTRKPTKYVFAENTSRFHRRQECTEFLANVDSPYVIRYIRNIPESDVDYTPRSNLL